VDEGERNGSVIMWSSFPCFPCLHPCSLCMQPSENSLMHAIADDTIDTTDQLIDSPLSAIKVSSISPIANHKITIAVHSSTCPSCRPQLKISPETDLSTHILLPKDTTRNNVWDWNDDLVRNLPIHISIPTLSHANDTYAPKTAISPTRPPNKVFERSSPNPNRSVTS
jgi:hypothetical protein